MAQEGLHSLKIYRLKIDLSKSFDRVRWLYIQMLLTHLGFCYDFIKWIKASLTTVSFVVLINSSTSPFFTVGRGLRQGCHLSSFLFLLVAEWLSHFILEAKALGSFKGIPISEVLYITHLLFVDDIIIFCDGSPRDIIKLKEGLLLLQVATSMVINDDKSTISY